MGTTAVQYVTTSSGSVRKREVAVDEVQVGQINPAAGLSVTVYRSAAGYVKLKFTFTAVSITVTDAAGSGSSGSLKIFDFAPGSVVPLGGRQNWTAFAEGAALTGAAGDAAFVIAFGSAAADAGDGALADATEIDFIAATSTITLSSGTGTGTKHSCPATHTPLDGTSTPVDLYINWSGSAATIDANSTISVTGDVTVMCMFMDDD